MTVWLNGVELKFCIGLNPDILTVKLLRIEVKQKGGTFNPIFDLFDTFIASWTVTRLKFQPHSWLQCHVFL